MSLIALARTLSTSCLSGDVTFLILRVRTETSYLRRSPASRRGGCCGELRQSDSKEYALSTEGVGFVFVER
jgi:hypothetical protein